MSVYFRYFVMFSPLKKRGPSFENTWILITQECIVPIRLKLAQWFLRTRLRFLKFVNVFSLFRYYLRLEKGAALHLNKLKFPSSKDALCRVVLKLVQWYLRRWKCEKFTDRMADGQTDGRTDKRADDGQQAIRKVTWAFSSGELKTIIFLS